MQIAWKTDPGRRKRENEDAVLVDEAKGLFLIADGMSAPRAGRVASSMAVRKAHAYLKEHMAGTDAGGMLPLLRMSLEHAHQEVQNASRKRRALSGMGSTIVILCVRGDAAYLSHVGDSRAYLFRRGALTRLTSDHSIECSIEQDIMLRDLFFRHNVRALAQALGPSKTVSCDGRIVGLEQGDMILLCTDGLTDMLSEDAIRDLLTGGRTDLETASAMLVDAANAAGGSDNISVILIAPLG